jgi:hypothetical protein
LFETFLILRRIQRDIVINEHKSSYEVPVIVVRFQPNLNFLNRISKNPPISNLMKIYPVGADLFHMDGQTERHDEANSRFSQFC